VLTVVLTNVQEPSTLAADRPTVEPAFFAYLTTCAPAPSLVAFNPSRFDPRRPYQIDDTSLADIRADLGALANAFNGLITYEFDEKLTPAILSAAHELGYRGALLGLWNPKARREIEAAAETIRQFHSKLALAVVIGNEGLIDNRYTTADIEQAAGQLLALLPPEIAIPVTTSEPIGEYGLPELRSFGDFLAPNIHPAIDLEGADPAAGAVWVRKRAQTLAAVAGKPVLVKETGMPNGGGPRHTPDSQRQFWEAYLREGPLAVIDTPVRTWISYAAAFEAFDMQWKAEKTGSLIEGHWGFLNASRKPYPVFETWSLAFTSGRTIKNAAQGACRSDGKR